MVALFQELRRELTGTVSREGGGADAVAARLAGARAGGGAPADRSEMLSELMSRSGLHNAVEEEAATFGACTRLPWMHYYHADC